MRRWSVVLIIAVAGLAIVGALIFFNKRVESEMRSQLYIPQKEHVTPEIQLLQQYVRIETLDGQEMAGARFLAMLLEKGGVKPEIIESAPGRANVYARIKGRRSGDGLLLLNHIDVVPAEAKQWQRPPFSGAIYLNQLWGRGSVDMKSIGLAELDAFLAVARTHKTPERDLVFLAVAGEEEGGTWGTGWLVQHRPDILDGIRYALNEGGITEMKEEQLTYFGVEVGTKMDVRVRLRAPSREQMERVRIALEPYITPRDPDRILPEVAEFLHAIAPHRLEIRGLLDDVGRTVQQGKFWLLPRGYKELMQNVVWTVGSKTDAHGATLEVNMYNLPDENPDARIAWLRSMIAPLGATIEEVLTKNGPAPISSTKTPLFDLIARDARAQYGPVPVGPEILAGSGNDSRFLRQRGITCYGFSPFRIDYFQALGIHGADERIRLDWYTTGLQLMRRLVSDAVFSSLR
ncbi:MAG TPA: M20/M25/M40 family metallo-hydrolase [Thermoanaerobaculia bacterium]|nr:M20/M25/M40 family metallo-hydrolase [Thermoanaerobaculia bacterium]